VPHQPLNPYTPYCYSGNVASQDVLNEINTLSGVVAASQPQLGTIWVYSQGNTRARSVCNVLYRYGVQARVHILDGQAALAGEFRELDSCDTY